MKHRGLQLLGALILGALTALFDPAAAWAATFTVNSDDDIPDFEPGNGVCRTTAGTSQTGICTLRAAIQEANALSGDDTIVPGAGTFDLSQGTSGSAGPPGIRNNLVITGTGRTTTFIRIGGTSPPPTLLWGISRSTVDIVGVTIVGGSGLLVASDATLSLTSSGVNQTVDRAIQNNGTVNIVNSHITNNSFSSAIRNDGILFIDSSLFSGNNSTTVSGSIMTNSATGNVGIVNSTFAFNGLQNASDGVVNRGTMLVVNSTFARNRFNGILSTFGAGQTALVNVTIADNTGTGVRFFPGASISSQNTLFAANSAGNCNAPITVSADPQQQQNFDSDGTCGFPAGTNLTGDPRILPLTNNGGPTLTVALASNSPAIDAANCSAFTPADQRGVSRPQLGNVGGTIRCDIGAFERRIRDIGQLGVPGISPRDGRASVNQVFVQNVTWDVPPPNPWRSLGTIDYRLRSDGKVIFWLRWDQVTDLFQLIDANGNPVEPAYRAGTPYLLRSGDVSVDLTNVRATGSGITGQRLTLTLPLVFAEALQGRTLQVEVAATGDGNETDPFRQVGTIAVGGTGAQVNPNNDAHEDEGGRVQRDKDDRRPPSEREQRERERTNRSGPADFSIQGNVTGVERAPEVGSLLVTIAMTRDESQVVQVPCSGTAPNVDCPDILVGDYLEADGYQRGVGDENDWFVASDGVEVTRNGRKVK